MKNTKIFALVATVALLVIGAAFTSFAAQYNWYQQDDEWRCKDKNGDDYYDAWAKSGADWYWLNDEGFMAREALVDDDTKYVDADGKMVKNDWKKVVDDEGDEHWMYFQAGGKKLVGKEDGPKPVTVTGKKYIFNTDGYMLSGWVGEGYNDLEENLEWKDGAWYCGDAEDGAVTYGWRQIECYNDFDEDLYDNNYWFYFQTNGKKFKADENAAKFVGADEGAILEQKSINGKKYAFDKYGRMKAEWEQSEATTASASISSYAWFQDTTIGAKFANGWFRIIPAAKVDYDNNFDETAKWFYAKSGKLAKSEIKSINGKKYGFNEMGEMVVGLNAVEYFEEDGKTCVAFAAIDDADKLATIDVMNPGEPEVDSVGVYYFSDDEDNDGSMKTGAQTVDVDGDAYNFYFSTKAGFKGLGLTGMQGNKYYYNGKKVAADDSVADYLFYKGVKDETTGKIVHVKPVNTDAEKNVYTFKELLGTSVVETISADDYVLISKTGTVASSGTKKDGNGYKAVYKKTAGVGTWTITAE